MVIAVAGFQTWVSIPEVGVTVSGTGMFRSTHFLTSGMATSEHGYPIGWLTLVLGVVIMGAAAMHMGDVLDADVALKSVVLTGLLSAAITALAILNKDTLIKVPADQLQGVALDTGTGAIIVLVASIAAVLAGFAILMFDGHAYVPARPRTSPRAVTTRPAGRGASTKKKKKAKKPAATAPEKNANHLAVAHGRDTAEAVEEPKPVEVAEQVVHTGGSAGQPPIWVTHWCAQLPASLRNTLAVPGVSDAGPVLLLHHGGGVAEEDLLSSIVRDEKPWLLDDLSYVSWEAGLGPVIVEIGRRYTVLELIRDDTWLTPLMQAAGIATTETRVETGGDEHGRYERHVTTIDVPVLIGAAVDQSGLVLRFAERAGDSADRWTRGLPALREGLAAEGMNTAHLHVADGPEGSIELRFNDTEELAVSVKE